MSFASRLFWHEVVEYDRDNGFTVNFHFPEAFPSDSRATPAQVAGIARFFGGYTNDALTDGQAHVMLCLRDYGTACTAKAAIKNLRHEAQVSLIAATLVSRVRWLRGPVIDWMDARHERGADYDTLVRDLGRCSATSEVVGFLKDVVPRLRDDGAPL